MPITFLLERFHAFGSDDAVVWNDQVFTYDWLRRRVVHWVDEVRHHGVAEGRVVVVEADFSPNAIAVLLALIQTRAIIVPLTRGMISQKHEFMEIAEPEISIELGSDDAATILPTGRASTPPLYDVVRTAQHPGLVLFSSGSTGKSKAALHDLSGILRKFHTPRHRLRTISFLLYDHIGGLNTLLYTLSNGGCLVTVKDRSPDAVFAAIEKYRVELLPTSPTFLNLALLTEAYRAHDISSLRTISYGTEAMPESTLKRLVALFPAVSFLQTYGLSETGILRSKSKESGSLFMKIGGEGFQTRVVDGLLQIKAESAMVGYLNTPSPFTDDGWFKTGDAVEVDGDYVRILGRTSDIINVGGEKVYPAEVESVIGEIPDIAEATVYSERHPLIGQMVCAKITPLKHTDAKELITTVKRHCAARLPPFKIPMKIRVVSDVQHTQRFKKARAV
jgi:long-chain acyl-CoA synthetase